MSARDPRLAGIERTRDEHVAALNANDPATWTRCFAPDGVQMPPHEPTNVGTEAIHAWSGGMLGAFRTEFVLDIDEVELMDDSWAFERGGYTIAMTPRDGGDALRDHGKYITIYERQTDGSWLIARDIWNSNHPLPGMPG